MASQCWKRPGQIQDTTEILTKNIALYAIACTAYLVIGYQLMYDGGIFLADIALDGASDAEAIVTAVLKEATDREGDLPVEQFTLTHLTSSSR